MSVCHIALFCVVLSYIFCFLGGTNPGQAVPCVRGRKPLLTAHSCSEVVVISPAYGMLASLQRGQRSESLEKASYTDKSQIWFLITFWYIHVSFTLIRPLCNFLLGGNQTY